MKRHKGESYADFMKRNELNKEIKGKDIEADIKDQIDEATLLSEKYLALNFYLMTSKDDYNFNYLRKLNNNNFKVDFLRRFCQTLSEISSFKVKDLSCDLFKDKFKYSKYEKFYSHSMQELNGEVELISIEVGGKKNQRMICWKKNKNDNILYVLGFQFNFNAPLYNHES